MSFTTDQSTKQAERLEIQRLISAAAQRHADRIKGYASLQDFVLAQPVPHDLNPQQLANWVWGVHTYWAPIWEGK